MAQWQIVLSGQANKLTAAELAEVGEAMARIVGPIGVTNGQVTWQEGTRAVSHGFGRADVITDPPAVDPALAIPTSSTPELDAAVAEGTTE